MTTNTKVYLAFDERMGLHRPHITTDDPSHPDFIYERPARIYAIYSSMQRLEHRLMMESQKKREAEDEAAKGLYSLGGCSLQYHPYGYNIPPEPQRRFIPIEVTPATPETVTLAHSIDYYNHIAETAKMGKRQLKRLTAQDGDLYYCSDTFMAATLAVGGCVDAVNAVTDPNSESRRAVAVVRPPGHHALRSEAMGFCFFNNCAIAAKHAIATKRASRVFILDWDIHHGNGIQELTYDDPNIFYLSIHRGPGDTDKPHEHFYPGTGRHDENGSGMGTGSNLNIGWGRAAMGNVEYAAAFSELVLPVLKKFNPDLIIVACGFDAAAGDCLGDCGLTPEMYYIMSKSLIQTTESMAIMNGPTGGIRRCGEIPIVVVLEGGYNLKVISDCMEATSLALLDEPWKTGTTTEKNIESSLAQYWKHEMMTQPPTTTSPTTAEAAPKTEMPSQEEEQVPKPHPKARLKALTSIKKAARSLAFSQSPYFGAYNCIQNPIMQCAAAANGKGGGLCTCRGCNCRKRLIHQNYRPSLLDGDRYPVKKQMLVRFGVTPQSS